MLAPDFEVSVNSRGKEAQFLLAKTLAQAIQ
jgi:hypothetical protein